MSRRIQFSDIEYRWLSSAVLLLLGDYDFEDDNSWLKEKDVKSLRIKFEDPNEM